MKDKPLFKKKIISGKYRSTVIDLPSKATTRSSKSMVLESLFNTLQFDIIDATFVELFAGSGSVGLEALSRGAKEIFFLEKNKDVLKILKKNITKTNPSACQVIGGDSFVNITKLESILEQKPTTAYFYIDPPFSVRDEMGDIYNKILFLIEKIPPKLIKMVIIEHMSGLILPNKIGLLCMKKSKKFGKTTLTYFLE